MSTQPRSGVAAKPRHSPIPQVPSPNAGDRQRRTVQRSRDAAITSDTINPLSPRFGMLVTEIAARVDPLGVVLNRHGLTQRDWAKLREMPAFQNALAAQHKAFEAIADLPSRIKMKAQLLTEALLDEMFELATNIGQPASARVSAFAQIKNLTGLEKPEDAAPQRAFNLTINLGNGKVKTAQAVTLEAIKERDSIAGDVRYVLSDGGGEIEDGEVATDGYIPDMRDNGSVLYTEGDEDTPGDQGEGGEALQSPRRTWSSFSSVSSGPAPSRHAAPKGFERAGPFSGASGGGEAADGGDAAVQPDDGGGGRSEALSSPSVVRSTSPLRSALERAKLSNDGR